MAQFDLFDLLNGGSGFVTVTAPDADVAARTARDIAAFDALLEASEVARGVIAARDSFLAWIE